MYTYMYIWRLFVCSIFGPPGPRRAPETPGTDPVRKVQVAQRISPWDQLSFSWALCIFGVGR